MQKGQQIMDKIEQDSIRFDHVNDLDAIMEQIGDARIVLLGEATHGTKEFYELRAELSKRLIMEKGFDIIAVEGDWPSCFAINEYVKGYKNAPVNDVFKSFTRWPTWMWANEEVRDFTEWLRAYNQKAQANVGFYGLDVYSLWESMDIVVEALERISPEDVTAAKRAFACFEPFQRNSESYAISASFYGEKCTDEVVELLVDVQKKRHSITTVHEEQLSLNINSLVILNGERYYRAMAKSGPDSWNIRDRHMVDVLERIMKSQSQSKAAKAIVWEHNTHIGDARATDMTDEGLLNVGQLLREKYGSQVYTVGFGTHRGTVTAAREWGGKIEVLQVPEAKQGSFEYYMHEAGAYNKFLLFNKEVSILNDIMGHRAIGVVYNPEFEHLGNYVPTQMTARYDAFIYVDQTNALTPLQVNEPVLI